MISEHGSQEVKKITEELLQKLHADYFNVSVEALESFMGVDVRMQDPHMFIGQGGQTLASLQRVISIIAGRRLKNIIAVSLDINNYKKEKTGHLKRVAQEAADEVAATKVSKTLPPMSSYERRIIHTELAQRTDVITHSTGEGENRSITITPR